MRRSGEGRTGRSTRQRSRGGRLWVYAGAALAAYLTACSPPPSALQPWIEKGQPADSIVVEPEALTDLALLLADGCADSLDSTFIARALQTPTDSSPPEPSAALTAFQRILTDHSCAVFRLQPQTYEAARSMASLAAVGIAVVVAYPPGMREPVESERLRRARLSALQGHAEHLRVKLIRMVRGTAGGYRIQFHDGETVRGLAEDRLIGQVYPAQAADGADTYHQIGELFWIARQPATTIEAHLDEWYGTMAYTFTRPALTALP